jgi:hypothetical protein
LPESVSREESFRGREKPRGVETLTALLIEVCDMRGKRPEENEVSRGNPRRDESDVERNIPNELNEDEPAGGEGRGEAAGDGEPEGEVDEPDAGRPTFTPRSTVGRVAEA